MRRRGAATPATLVLERAGVAFTQHTFDHDARTSSYGAEAAAALGLDPVRVLKTLLAETDLGLVVAVVPVSGSLDLKALAASVGSKRAAMADPRAAERATGYVVGGISPLGQRTRLRTVIDAEATTLDRVLVSGGRRGLDVELSPADLVELTDALVARIARPLV